MKIEISKEIMILKSNNVIPALLNDQFLLTSNIIENLEDIDRTMYHVSPMGTHIKILDNYETTIEISIPNIRISSKDSNKIIAFYNALVDKKDKLKVSEFTFGMLVHIEKDNIMNEVTSNLTKLDSAELTSLGVERGKHYLDMYECSDNKLHMNYKQSETFDTNTEIKNLNLDLVKAIKDGKEFVLNFIKKDLNYELQSL